MPPLRPLGATACRQQHRSSFARAGPRPPRVPSCAAAALGGQRGTAGGSARCTIRASISRQQASLPAPARSSLPGSWRGRQHRMGRTAASMQQGNDAPPPEGAGVGNSSSSSSSNGGGSGAGSSSGAGAIGGLQAGGGNGSSSGGSGGSGNGGGGNGIRPPSSWSGGDSSSSSGGGDGPFGHMSPQLLARSVLALAALSGVLLAAVVKLLLAGSAQEGLLEALSRQAASSAEASSTSEAIAALKRLLREVFAEQLGVRGRLTALEKAAAAQLEAADDYALQQQAVDSSGGWKRAPVRFSGFLSAAGVLPWSQEADGAAALAMLSALGAGGQAAGQLQLHSVLAGGKRRITAGLAPAKAAGAAAAAGGPVMQLQQLLYRVEVKPWLQLMIAPLGGGLHALARGITPIVGDFGCSTTLRQGHGLTALSGSTGSGKAVSCSRGRLSAAAGFFVGGAGKSAVGQVQLRGRGGSALSLVAASRRPNRGPCSTEQQQPAPAGLRFLGTQAPGCLGGSSSCQEGAPAGSGRSSVVGLAGVLPLADALTATAWAERGSVGSGGWGVGLYSQPDHHGVELGMVLAKPPSAGHAAFRESAAPVFCELAAKLPVGDGLSIAPGALVAFRGAGASVAFCMGSSWRF